MARLPYRDMVAFVAALAGPLVVALALVPWRDSVTSVNAALILVVVAVAVAANGNRLAGALAAVSAAAWFDFFHTEPYQRFTISDRADIETTVLLLIVGLAVSQLAAHGRRLKVITITDAGYLKRIHDTAEMARSTTSPRVVVEHVRRELIDLLNLEECRFEYGSLLGKPPRLERDGSIVWGRRPWDVDRRALRPDEVELRAYRDGSYYGRFMLRGTPGVAPPLQARLVAVTLADQIGAMPG
jgi:Domain of unknown function (DUF4118)